MDAVYAARDFLAKAGPVVIPVDVEGLARAACATVTVAHDLDGSESGFTFRKSGGHVVVVNGNHIEARRRFTVLHEVAHIVLGLPSKHGGQKKAADGSVRGARPKEEALCDVFAAECLFPLAPFRADTKGAEVSLACVRRLAGRYGASITSTASRFADKAEEPCAFVFSVAGSIRSVARSKSLIDAGGWIEPNAALPEGSIARDLTEQCASEEGRGEVAAGVWFNGGISDDSTVIEDSMAQEEWGHCLSLIWVKELVSTRDAEASHQEDEELLPELDGVLKWKTRSRHR